MSSSLLKIKRLFSKQWLLVSALVFLLLFQLFYSFLFPAYGSNDNWQPVATYLPKFQVQANDSFLLEKVYPLISSEYRLSSDIGHNLELALNFNAEYFDGHTFLSRPLYPFLIYLLSLPVSLFVTPSYGIIFGLAIFLNFILITLAVLLLFSVLKKLLSLKVAFLSSVLLIFSPYVRASLIQPLAEMLMVFVLSLTAYLLYSYIKKPSTFKLVTYSLIIGVCMLGKMFFAISFFILLLAIYFRRYKEGIIFLIIHLIPLGWWYLWVTQVWYLPYYIHEAQHFRMGLWLLDVFKWSWYETARVFLAAVPNFIRALIYGFLLIPVFFSIIGFKALLFKNKNVFYFGSLFSVFVLFFIMNLYFAHHAFLLFPIIYPAAVLGIDRIAACLKSYQSWLSPVFYTIIIGLIIIISNINIYKVFDYIGF